MKRRRQLDSIELLLLLVAIAFMLAIVVAVIEKKESEEATQETVSESNTGPEETISHTKSWKIMLTSEEFKELCRLVYSEAQGENIKGQISVAAVVINRMQSSEFPDTIYEVIHQSGAFSTIWDGEIHIRDGNKYVSVKYEDIPETTLVAVERALYGEDPTEELLFEKAIEKKEDTTEYAEGGALYFYNPDACSDEALESRANIKVEIRIGNHLFYKIWDK